MTHIGHSRIRMKKIDPGHTITILANLGVITGIAFLAVEIAQNNEQLVAQARFNYYQQRGQSQDSWGADLRLQETLLKLQRGEEISELEIIALQYRIRAILASWEYEYFEYQSGNISLEQFNLSGKRGFFLGRPGLGEIALEVWSRYQEPAEFVRYMDENVFY